MFQDRLFSDNSKHIQSADVNDFDASRDFSTRQITSADIRRPRSYDEIARTSAADFTGASKPWPVPAEPKRELPLITMPAAGQANIGMGGVPVLGQLFPLPRAQTLPSSTKPESSRQILHQANLSTSSSGSSSIPGPQLPARRTGPTPSNWPNLNTALCLQRVQRPPLLQLSCHRGRRKSGDDPLGSLLDICHRQPFQSFLVRLPPRCKHAHPPKPEEKPS